MKQSIQKKSGSHKTVTLTIEMPYTIHERFKCAAAWNDESMEDYAVRILTDITEADEDSAGVDQVRPGLAAALKCYCDKALLPRAHFLRDPHQAMKCLQIGDFKPLELIEAR
ncbi:MAG: hypothetical protein WCS52_00680 [bacterium]